MKKILNIGWLSFLIIGLLIFISLKTPEIPLKIVLYAYIGSVIGNAFRIYGMPDTYFTNGTLLDNVKKRFYWNHGPQLTSMFAIPYFGTLLIGTISG